MLKLVTTNQFRKDLKRIKKRGLSINKLEEVLKVLLNKETLEQRYRDHALSVRSPYGGFFFFSKF